MSLNPHWYTRENLTVNPLAVQPLDYLLYMIYLLLLALWSFWPFGLGKLSTAKIFPKTSNIKNFKRFILYLPWFAETLGYFQSGKSV